MIRDIVVLRCLACIDPMDRQAFTNALKDAFDDQALKIDVFLLAHKKICDDHCLVNTFPTGNSQRARDQKTRCRRKSQASAQKSGEHADAAASSSQSPEPKTVPLPAFVTSCDAEAEVDFMYHLYHPYQTAWDPFPPLNGQMEQNPWLYDAWGGLFNSQCYHA